MEKLPTLINETAVRNEQVFAYWLALSDHTGYGYNKKIELVAEKFCIGENTAKRIITLSAALRK